MHAMIFADWGTGFKYLSIYTSVYIRKKELDDVMREKRSLRNNREKPVIIPCPVNPKYTNLILGIRLGLGLGLGLD